MFILSCATPEDSTFFAGELFSCLITVKSCKKQTAINCDSSETASLAGRFMGIMGLSRQNSDVSNTPVIETITYENNLGEIHEESPTASSFDYASPVSGSPKRLMLNTSFQKTKIAWAFAQMSGQFTIDDNYIKTDAINTVSEKILYDTPGQKRRSSVGTPKGGGSLSEVVQLHEKSQKSLQNALPLFNTPPTILFSDLELEEGEEATFKYELLLPANLPPSHRGKVVRFQYKLIIGIQKSILKRVTQIVTIPFRFFNRTNQDGSRAEFELLEPIIHTKDQAQVIMTGKDPLSPLQTTFLNTPHSGGGLVPHSDSMASMRSSTLSKSLETDVQTNSIDNVLGTLQSMGKVNYDICKNNQLICQLQLPRIGFRLGESVIAVLNFAKSSIPCYHVSVFLESHEVVEQEFTNRSKEYLDTLTKKRYGEFHQSVVNTQRSCAILNIPQKATPDFVTSAVSFSWSLKLEFITGIGGDGAPKIYRTSTELEGFTHSRGLSSVDVEPFDCTIPLKVFGAFKTPKKQKKTLQFEIS